MLIKIFQFKKKKAGFTLLEVIFTILIISIGLAGISSLFTQTIALTANASLKLTAAYLTQEGIEIVRNIRDGNWLEQRTDPGISWSAGLGTGDWQADYNDFALTSYGEGSYLKIDPNGFYNYDLGTDAKFKRKITITTPATPECPVAACLLVKVEVSWQEKGRTYQIVAQENLYNWK